MKVLKMRKISQLLFKLIYINIFFVLLLSLYCEMRYDCSLYTFGNIFQELKLNGGILFRGFVFVVNHIYKLEYEISNWFVGISNVSLSAPQKIIEAVGFSSLILGWIIEKLDNSEFGIKYNDILDKVWKHYKIMMVIHFTVILTGVWMSMNSKIEGTLLSSVLVVLGFIPQIIVLNTFLFNKDKRRKKAIQIWNDRFKRKNASQIKQNLLILADEVNIYAHSKNPELTECFLQNFLKYVKVAYSGDNIITIIKDVAEIWERLNYCDSDKIKISEKTEIMRYLIKSVYENDKKKTCYILLSLGYLYSRLRFYNMDDLSKINNDMKIRIYDIYEEFDKMKSYSNANPFCNYTIFAFALLLWQLFINGSINYYSNCVYITQGVKFDYKEKDLKYLTDLFQLINVKYNINEFNNICSLITHIE